MAHIISGSIIGTHRRSSGDRERPIDTLRLWYDNDDKRLDDKEKSHRLYSGSIKGIINSINGLLKRITSSDKRVEFDKVQGTGGRCWELLAIICSVERLNVRTLSQRSGKSVSVTNVCKALRSLAKAIDYFCSASRTDEERGTTAIRGIINCAETLESMRKSI